MNSERKNQASEKLFVIITVIVVLLLFISFYPIGYYCLSTLGVCTAISCHVCSQPAPSEPEITYAEFPFTIVYEINGEQFTYEDKIVCEYDGVRADTAYMGKYRTWSRRYASGSCPVLCTFDDGSCIQYRISTNAAHLMGDQDAMKYITGESYTGIYLSSHTGVSYRLTSEEVLEQYGINIISVEVTPPIQNTFND